MKLHENRILFRQAIQATADQMGIPAIYVEKDYWVTVALYMIFNDPIGDDTVFKGGTALSKCCSMIDRFSEDIDLVMQRRAGETDYLMKKKIRTISKILEAYPARDRNRRLNHKKRHEQKNSPFLSEGV